MVDIDTDKLECGDGTSFETRRDALDGEKENCTIVECISDENEGNYIELETLNN